MRPVRWENWIAAALLAAALTSTGTPAPAADRKPAAAAKPGAREGWPETRGGELARRWTDGFNGGEKAMRACLGEVLSAEALGRKSVDDRMVRYRELRDQFGRLTFASVVQVASESLTVSLRDADGAPHEFVFTLERKPPFRLETITIRTRQVTGHGGLGGFHH